MFKILKAEAIRYKLINFKNWKELIKTLSLNILIIMLIYFLFSKDLSSEYIAIYSMVWFILSIQLSITKELFEEFNNKTLKYYGKKIEKIIYTRYIFHLMKSSAIIYLILNFMWAIKVINYRFEIIDLFIIFIGGLSLYWINYIIAMVSIIYKKYQAIINLLRVGILYFLFSSNNILLPFSVSANIVVSKLLSIYMESNIYLIMLNSIVYIILGMIIVKFVNYKLINKILV